MLTPPPTPTTTATATADSAEASGLPAIEHHHTTADLPSKDVTLLGELLKTAEQLTDVGVPRALFGDLAAGADPDALVCAFTAQKWVMLSTTPLEVRDAVWRYLIERVRAEAGNWQFYAIATQYNALKMIAVRLAPKRVSAAKIRRANEETVSEFLMTCGRMQIKTAHVGARLVNQTRYHATKAYWDRERRARLYNPQETEVTGTVGYRRMHGRPKGHPDFVLIRLIIDTTPPPRNPAQPAPVDARIVGRQRRRHRVPRQRGGPGEGHQLKAIDAELVARTRLERIWPPDSKDGLRKTIDHAATEVDKIEGGEVGKKRRQRAETIIIRELADHLTPSKRPQPDTPTAEPPDDSPTQ